jgi:hypothetical protein
MATSAASAASPVKKIVAKLTAAVAAALAAGAAAATLGAVPASASTTGNWMMTGWNIHQLYHMDPGTTSHFFNTQSSYATGPNSGTSPVSDGFSASGVLVYNSYAQFASDIANHAIAPSYQWVMYDPEMWAQTPVTEQRNPALYLQKFGQLAHANGLKVVEVPGRDLGLVAGSACPKTRGENLDHWYLRCNIPGAVASSADILVVQDQVNTLNVPEFDYLYSAARSEAQAANPQIVVDAEVSTTYGSATQMVTAARSAHADGIYINATTPAIGKTDRLLRAMKAAGF